jgi:hypothetical protein
MKFKIGTTIFTLLLPAGFVASTLSMSLKWEFDS